MLFFSIIIIGLTILSFSTFSYGYRFMFPSFTLLWFQLLSTNSCYLFFFLVIIFIIFINCNHHLLLLELCPKISTPWWKIDRFVHSWLEGKYLVHTRIKHPMNFSYIFFWDDEFFIHCSIVDLGFFKLSKFQLLCLSLTLPSRVFIVKVSASVFMSNSLYYSYQASHSILTNQTQPYLLCFNS